MRFSYTRNFISKAVFALLIACSATYGYAQCPIDAPANAVWGTQHGEGDFDGGLNGWSVSSEEGWEWSETGDLSRGAYNQNAPNNNPNVVSNTQCNGAMVFDSDFLDNAGIPGNFGYGDCPQVCISELTSPNIDLSGVQTDGLFLQFSQSLRQFQSEYFLSFSTDGGDTWTDPDPINEEYPVNSNHINNVFRYAICGIDNPDQIMIRFIMNGNYYYWGIDDVFLLNESSVDLQANDFMATAQNYRTPASQVDLMAFLVDIENVGNGTATNANVNAQVIDLSNGQTMYTADLGYPDVEGCFLDENRVFGDTYAFDGGVGSYGVQYVVSADEDNNTVNDTVSSIFEVTENVFGKLLPEDEAGVNYMGGWRAAASEDYFGLGNYYYVPNGDGYKIDLVRTGTVVTPDDGDVFAGFINVRVYRWYNVDENNEVGADERELIGGGDVFISSDIPTNYRDLQIEIHGVDADGDISEDEDALLADNAHYVVMVNANPLDVSDPPYFILGVDFGESTSFYGGAMSLAFDSLGIQRYSSFLTPGTDGTQADLESRTLFSTSLSVYAQMSISSVTGTEDINEKIGLDIYPNPANTDVFVDIALEEVSETVNVEVVSIDGKVVLSRNFDNVKEDRLQLDVRSLTDGIYIMNVRTEEGFNSSRFMIAK